MLTIAKQTLYTCGCGASEFNFRCGFALCGAKKIFATPSTVYNTAIFDRQRSTDAGVQLAVSYDFMCMYIWINSSHCCIADIC